jgi:anti-sigma factor RsiW
MTTIHCRELVELVTAYLDGALPPRQREDIDSHLSRCDGCTTYVRQFQDTIAAIRRSADSVP